MLGTVLPRHSRRPSRLRLAFVGRRATGLAALAALALSLAGPAQAQENETHAVPLLAAADDARLQGFVRVVNRSDDAGEVTVEAIDDAGESQGTITLALDPLETFHFNSDDLENGNANKNIDQGVGAGEGSWRLALTSTLDIAVNAYMRTAEGFLTSMHDVVPRKRQRHRIPTFNPASNTRQASRLRITNLGAETADVTVAGVDDQLAMPGRPVTLSLAAGASHTLTASAIETGEGLTGGLGDGSGKWRLNVEADQPLAVMSLLASEDTGNLTNLSSRPGPRRPGAKHVVPLMVAADHPYGQGFVRVLNHSEAAGEVTVLAVDDAGAEYGPVALAIGAGEAIHFNSGDLERGNADKGLPEGVGDGQGDWRLELTTPLDIEALAYMRTSRGFLTAMHDLVEPANGMYSVPTFNPGSNTRQASLLRLVNMGAESATATIRGVDDDGASPGGDVSVALPAGAARTLTAAALESGEGVDGALGDGRGKWRLTVEADQPLLVMSLLESRASGHLTNLSSESPRLVNIPDEELRAAVATTLGVAVTDPITTAQMRRLLDLRVSAGGAIADLRGLETAIHLAALELAVHDVSDLSPLANAIRLEELELASNQIRDLTPLAGLTELRVLGLANNRIEDVTPLAGLTNLIALNLGANPLLTDITPLAELTGLVELHLWVCGLSDISALSRMVRMRGLYVWGNALRDVSALQAMADLEQFLAQNNVISDISGLAGLGNLTKLVLSNNAIADISPLAGLTQLTELLLADNNIRDINALASLTNLRTLNLDFNDIRMIDALASAIALRSLQLEGNFIADIAPLATLPDLADLNLAVNNISDLAPLTELANLGEGLRIDVRENPLSEDSINTHIPTLTGFGVEVLQSEPYPDDDEFPGSRITQIYNDNMLVMHIAEDVQAAVLGGNRLTGENALATYLYARHFYRWFEDDFDFLLLLSNLDDILDHQGTIYSGVYQSTMNDVRGIGTPTYYLSRYGSRGRLRGVIHFPWNAALGDGPALHELQHPWSNFALPTATPGHWGYSSANGQLGGFDFDTLVDLGEGRYSAPNFPPGGRGVNDAPYSPIELYQAGYVPPEDVPDTWYAPDGSFVEVDAGNTVFTSEQATTISIDQFIADVGERVPSAAQAPRAYRGAVILLVDEDHPVSFAQATLLSNHIDALMHPGEDDDARFNYFEATDGRATLKLDGLAESRKAQPTSPPLPPSFGTAPEPQFCQHGPHGLTHAPHPRRAAAMAVLAEQQLRAWLAKYWNDVAKLN